VRCWSLPICGRPLYVRRASPPGIFAESRFRVKTPECGRLDFALSLLSFELAARVGAPAQMNNFNELIDSYRNCCIPSESTQSQLLASTRSHRDRYLIEISGPPTKPEGAIMARSARRPAGAMRGEHSSSERPAHMTARSYDDIVTPLIHAGGSMPAPPRRRGPWHATARSTSAPPTPNPGERQHSRTPVARAPLSGFRLQAVARRSTDGAPAALADALRV